MKPRHASHASALLILAQGVLAAQPGEVTMSSAQVLPVLTANELVSAIDSSMELIRKTPWTMNDRLGNEPADETGRRPQDDIDEFLQTEQALATLTDLRRRVTDSIASTAPLTEAERRKEGNVLRQVNASGTCRNYAVINYWGSRRTQTYHSNLITALIGRLPEAQRAIHARELAALGKEITTVHSDLSSAIDSCNSIKTDELDPADQLARRIADAQAQLDPQFERYNDLRIRIATVLNSLGPEGNEQSRSKACPVLDPPPAGPDRGAAYRSRPDPYDYYPPEARNMGITGMVRVLLGYDTSGCVQSAKVIETSGSDLLDDAAARFAFDVTIMPAVINGESVSDGVIIPIRFSLRGEPEP